MANSRHTGFLSTTKKAVIQHALDKRITVNEEMFLVSIRSEDIDPSWSDFGEPYLVEFFSFSAALSIDDAISGKSRSGEVQKW